MRDALYLNGVFDSVLKEIVKVQSAVPDQPLFLQPYANAYVSILAKQPPSPEDPVRVFISISDDLPRVRYAGEIIGWGDKHSMPMNVKHVFEALLRTFQPGEKNFYDKGVNAIMVRRVIELETPFPVGALIVRSTMKPHKVRTAPGGWSIVLPAPVEVQLPSTPVFGWGLATKQGPKSEFDEIPLAETYPEDTSG